MFFRFDSPPSNRKVKKSALKHAAAHALDPNDQAALIRRAERFQREHDLERQKSVRNGGAGGSGQASLKANYQNAHLFNDRSQCRSESPPSFPNLDDPEIDPDPVCYSTITASETIIENPLPRTSLTGIVIPLSERPKKYSRIISV